MNFTNYEIRHQSELGQLCDPKYDLEPLNLNGFDPVNLVKFLTQMLLIRSAEEAIGDLVESKEAGCPCHLAIGQEAIPVGISHHLNCNDRVFGAHRSHGHYLALGGDINQLIAEVLGKETGCSRGMGGSMHLIAQDQGFYGSVPIVGATIPIATGAAFALKMDGKQSIAVSYFGDGATEEGVFHESMNLASIKKLPILFVCENNLYSSHLDIAQRQPSDMCARYAKSHRVPYRIVDGNDVAAVARAGYELIQNIRSGDGPGFIEAITYRHRGHVGPDPNVDVGLRRKEEDVEAWLRRDPIHRLLNALLLQSVINEEQVAKLREGIDGTVKIAVDLARKAPYPHPEALLKRVHVKNVKIHKENINAE